MAESKIRIGILGYGSIGKIHYDVLSSLKSYQLNCVADSKETPKNTPEIHTYKDYKSLLKNESNNLDAVIIALPTKFHVEATKDSMNFGLNVLLEKPMGSDSQEAIKIRDYASQKNKKLMIGMTGRYHPEFSRAYDSIQEGKIGKIVHLDERMHWGLKDNPNPYLKKEEWGRGIGLTNGIHTIDRFIWFMNSPIKEVQIAHIGTENFNGKLEDNINGEVKFANGKKGAFSLSWTKGEGQEYVFSAVGTDGTITVHGFKETFLQKKNEKKESLFKHNTDDITKNHQPGIKKELEVFAKLLQDPHTQVNHVDDCIEAQKVIDQFYINVLPDSLI